MVEALPCPPQCIAGVQTKEKEEAAQCIAHLLERLDDPTFGAPWSVVHDGGLAWIEWCCQQFRDGGLRDVTPSPASEVVPPPPLHALIPVEAPPSAAAAAATCNEHHGTICQ